MNTLILRRFFAVVLSLSLAYLPLLHAQQSATDHAAPVIRHTPSATPLAAGRPAVFAAAVTDDQGVKSVILHYRKKGAQQYRRETMMPSAGTSLYKTTLPYEAIQAPGVEYYIEAADLSGNVLLRGSSFTPLLATVTQLAPTTPVAAKKAVTAQAKKKPGGMGTLKWVLAALGVGAVAAIAVAAGGGGGGGDNNELVVTGTVPQ
ncbi:MAG: hypothetical protein ACR2RB_08640 [Gammaproteobacteria bacterium]